MKIAVAMSGGVDSSVAAHILKCRGHEVLGLVMITRPRGHADTRSEESRGPGSIRDAERVARQLDLKLHVVDVSRDFEKAVVDHFVSEYARGRTPNPCVRCNEFVKFGTLLSEATTLGATHLATGHHAVVRTDPEGSDPVLACGKDAAKDQSYFLYRLTRDQLRRTLLPIGGLSKQEVRRRARECGLDVADRPESQDVCFIPRGGIGAFLRERAPNAVRPGPILDLAGDVVGEHQGIALYTVGQRSSLGLSRPRPTYVIRVDPAENAIVVGDEEDLYSRSLAARDLCWTAGSPPAGDFVARARVRYAAPAVPCTVRVDGNEAQVSFDEPQRAVAPGQAVVFYDGEVVLGGGTITERA